jgi:hypothetical protein
MVYLRAELSVRVPRWWRSSGCFRSQFDLPAAARCKAGDDDMAEQKTNLAARWASATEVLDRLAKVRAARAAQRDMVDLMDQHVRRRETELEASLGDLPPAQRASVVARATGSLKQQLRAAAQNERVDLLRAAAEHGGLCKSASAHYRSPMQMLMRDSLGSERRGRIHQQIENSGPAELAALAEYAAGTKDAELAAALCSRNSAMKTADRPFSSADLAEAICGEEFRTVTAALREIEAVSQEIANDDRAFMTGRRNPADRMSVELLRRGEMRVEDGDDFRAGPTVKEEAA